MHRMTGWMMAGALLWLGGCSACQTPVHPEQDAGFLDGGPSGGGGGDLGGGAGGGGGLGGGDGRVCRPGDTPDTASCEVGCGRWCDGTDGGWGECRPQSNPLGLCTAQHAQARCASGGQCTRGPCETDYYDFDPSIPGCETHCAGLRCDLADGGSITLSAPPLHEQSAVFRALSSGGSFGALAQTNAAGLRNVGILGEVAAGTSTSDAGITNYGGFMSVGRGPATPRK